MEQQTVPKPLAAGHQAKPTALALLELYWPYSALLKLTDVGSAVPGAEAGCLSTPEGCLL